MRRLLRWGWSGRKLVEVVAVYNDIKQLNFVANYPLATIPFRYVESSGRPYGLHVIAKANEEDKIISFMSVWERTVEPRRVPDLDAL
jgi:Asp-tRNA(Asn)/Glu-tRNA(Gln) amidotransferase A subunit family amidase